MVDDANMIKNFIMNDQMGAVYLLRRLWKLKMWKKAWQWLKNFKKPEEEIILLVSFI